MPWRHKDQGISSHDIDLVKTEITRSPHFKGYDLIPIQSRAIKLIVKFKADSHYIVMSDIQ